MGDIKATVLDVAKYPQFTEAELNKLLGLFCKYSDTPTRKGTIDLDGLKRLLEDLDLTQTHLQAKETYELCATEGGVINLDAFMKLVRDLTAKNGTISLEVILKLASQEEVDVDDVGVGGAAQFFDAKVKALEAGDAVYRALEEKKKQEEEKKIKKEEFKKKKEQFQPQPSD